MNGSRAVSGFRQKSFIFLSLFRFVFSPSRKAIRMAILFPVARVDGSICGSVGLSEEGKQRPFYRWLSSKQRPATSLSIGGSLKRRTTATVAAEANLKVKLRDLCACLRFFMFQSFKYACLYINHLIFLCVFRWIDQDA